MELQDKFSGHIILLGLPAWGHLRPLCALATKFVKESPDVVVALFIVGGFEQRVESEINRYLLGPEIHRKENIRIINLGGEGAEVFELMPTLVENFPVFYDKLMNCETISSAAVGKTFAVMRDPTAAIIDVFLLDILRSIRSRSGKKVPVYAWQTTYSSATLRIMGPEEYGGLGNVAAKADAKAEATDQDLQVISDELYRPAGGKLITVHGLPPMYDYEFTPQEPRKDLLRNFFFNSAYNFARECDGFFGVSSPVYEKESLDEMRAWLAETNRPVYAVGPLAPPGVGREGLSESSQRAEIKSLENGSEFQIFLDKTLKSHGKNSTVYFSFGSTFWPPKHEYVWIFVDSFLEHGIPFIMSYAAEEALVPEGMATKIKESGLGLLSKWAPQQTILNHAATGWILTHCGQNSVTEALTQGIPLIAWPIDADQPENATHLTLNLDVAFELIEVRTGPGLKPLYRGVTPAGTVEAVKREANDVVRRLQGPEGARKRKNAEAMKDRLAGEWEEGGNALTDLRKFLTDTSV
ncbi:glycosyltransferase family 1 protein [Ramaria rubella]|nr:glycosyltransferase family 1 protein [Ramaria rubella]